MEKRTSLVSRIFTWVLLALVVLAMFVPVFTVKAEVSVGSSSETVFSANVSTLDVLSVAFMSDEQKQDELSKLSKQRLEDIAKVVANGDAEENAIKKVNGYSYMGKYALLNYFGSETDEKSLGIDTKTWLILAAVVEILLLVCVALDLFFSYMCMQYDNVSLPRLVKSFGFLILVFGVGLMAIYMFTLRAKVLAVSVTTVMNVLAYIFAGICVFLPIYECMVFKRRKSYMKKRK